MIILQYAGFFRVLLMMRSTFNERGFLMWLCKQSEDISEILDYLAVAVAADSISPEVT